MHEINKSKQLLIIPLEKVYRLTNLLWTCRTLDMDGQSAKIRQDVDGTSLKGEVVEIKDEVVDIGQSTLAVAMGDETSGYAQNSF